MKGKELTITTDGTDTLIINKFSWYWVKLRVRRILNIKAHLMRIYCWYHGHVLTLTASGHKMNCERGCGYPVGVKYLVEKAKADFRIGIDMASDAEDMDRTVIMVLEVTANNIYKIVNFDTIFPNIVDIEEEIKKLQEKYGVKKVYKE